MSEPHAATADASDDLPRTLRREREARYRETLERAGREARPGSAPVPPAGPSPTFGAPAGVGSHTQLGLIDDADGRGVTVTAFKVPFLRLVLFFLKAAVAAIPAIILLGLAFWMLGFALRGVFPELFTTGVKFHFPSK